MRIAWKGFGIVTSTGALMLNYIGRSRQQVIDMATSAHSKTWRELKRETAWKVIPLEIMKSPREGKRS